MPLLENLVRLFAPHICLGCGAEEDRLLCESCVTELVPVPSRCYRCKAVTEDYKTCRECSARSPLDQVAVFTHHQALAKELVHRMKYERAQAGAREMAELMSALLPSFGAEVLVCHIPTATSRVRKRGYDQALLLSRFLARGRSVPRAALLLRTGQAHQVGSRRTERLRQLEGAFRPTHMHRAQGKHVVLVDDVLTTGATLERAAQTLRRAGAKRVSAIVFSQA